MRAFRRILFWILALVYAVLCPLLIVHALGYWNAGLIVVEAVPDDARVLIDGRPVAQDMPATIPRLPPGRYTLRVEREGHRPWTRDVNVERRQARVLDHVFLLPETNAMETITDAAFDSLHPIDGTPYIVLLAKGPAEAARVFDHRQRRLAPLFPTNAVYASRTVRRIFTTPESPYLLARIDDESKACYLWRGLADEPGTTRDVTALIPGTPAEIRWSTGEPELLFCFQQGVVHKVDLARGTNEPAFATDWLGMGVFDDLVFGLDAEARFVRKTFDGERIGAEDTELRPNRRLFGKPRFIHVVPMADDSLLFHEAGGALFQTELPRLLAARDIEGVRVFPQADRALVWRRNALGLLEPSARKDEDTVFDAGRRIRWLYEGSATVASPHILYGGVYALCVLDGRVTVFDLRTGQAHPEAPRDAFAVRKGTAVHYVDRNGMLYALEPNAGRLVAIRILPIVPALERLFPARVNGQGALE